MPRYSLEVSEVLCVQHKEQKTQIVFDIRFSETLTQLLIGAKGYQQKNKNLDEHPGKER